MAPVYDDGALEWSRMVGIKATEGGAWMMGDS
jgi:hypothetical protein